MSEKTTGQIAARIRSQARRQNITQAALAAALGLTQQAVSRRLSGEVEISIGEIEILARALNVSVSWLFGETAEEAPVPELVSFP